MREYGKISIEENEKRKAYIESFLEWERENQWLVAVAGDEWLGEFGTGGAIPLKMYN